MKKYQISIWLAIYFCLSCLIHLSIFCAKFDTISILLYFFIFNLHFLQKINKTYVVHLTWSKPLVLYKQPVTELSKWESKHWLCTIHNGSLETLIWSIMTWTKKFKYCELSRSLGRNPGNWRNIGDPHGRLAGDPHGPIFSLETRILLLQTPIPYFRLRPPDFHWRSPDFIEDPIFSLKIPTTLLKPPRFSLGTT